MSHLTPNTVALRYFVEAAKCLNFTQASENLNISQAAISKQIKQLENLLGVDLFIRKKQRIKLTHVGEIYFKDTLKILQEIELASLKAKRFEQSVDEINLSVLPTFASRWLIPRLKNLYKEYPEISVKLSSNLATPDFHKDQYDMAVVLKKIPNSQINYFHIMNERLIVVASRSLIQEKVSLNQLERLPILTFSPRPELWEQWFQSVNRIPPIPKSGLIFENFQMLIHAAISGLGVALIPDSFIQDELKSGTLIQIHGRSLASAPQYLLAIPKEKVQDEKIVKFKTWITKQTK